MEKKQLLDKDGNPITKERIEEVFKELYKDVPPLLERVEWEEDGQTCHTWKINGGRAYTNDAGAEMIREALKKDIENMMWDKPKTKLKDDETYPDTEKAR